ncbi:MAG: iron ABC transporter permease [Ruminococcaceae bacterium]|nr:iron ABC transporter permease [Oscillospiraceae bacterium]
MKNRQKLTDTEKTVIITAVLLLSVMAALVFGSVQMDLTSLIGGIMKRDGFEAESVILYSLRLPRIAAGLLAGAGLSASGVLLQAVTGNALASPGIIGVNSGAGFAVIMLLAFFPFATGFMPFAAFFGAFIATMLILFLCSKISFSSSSVILSGVAVSALLNAGISFISYADNDILSLYSYFSVGGLSQIFPERLVIPAVIIAFCVALTVLFAPKIDTLCLGDSIALSLGVNVKLLRFCCLVLASALAGAVVSFAGLLGFVGLVVPHITRRIFGTAIRRLTFNCVLVGGILVVLSDLCGRMLLSPTEVPVGIVMAFIGAPFLFYLLLRGKKNA